MPLQSIALQTTNVCFFQKTDSAFSGDPCPSKFHLTYGRMPDDPFLDKYDKVRFIKDLNNTLFQDSQSCAELCEKNEIIGQGRRLKCCTFEWSEKEKRCKLHHNCVPISGERKKGFFTCRKEGCLSQGSVCFVLLVKLHHYHHYCNDCIFIIIVAIVGSLIHKGSQPTRVRAYMLMFEQCKAV